MSTERIERRLTAVLAADVAGYSRLMSGDEEGTLASLKAHRSVLVDPKIAEHHGRVVKTTRSTSPLRFRTLAINLCALALTVLTASKFAHAGTEAAWVEFTGPGREASIRVIVSGDAGCPTLTADGEPLEMRVRAEPGPIFSEGDLPPSGDFPVRICELTAPKGKARVLLDGRALPLPSADIKRIVVFGDTGCRITGQIE